MSDRADQYSRRHFLDLVGYSEFAHPKFLNGAKILRRTSHGLGSQAARNPYEPPMTRTSLTCKQRFAVRPHDRNRASAGADLVSDLNRR